jgi:hypothetical protein
MPAARKTFKSPFLLEKSKLTRLLEAVKARFEQAALPAHLLFQVQLRGQKLIQTASLDEVLAIDNSSKSRIEDLYVTCGDTETSDTPRNHIITVDFDGSPPASIEVGVRGKDSAWVNETFAAIEEQVERTLQRSVLTRLSYSKALTSALLVGVFLAGIAIYVDLMYSHAPTKLTNNMWLTDQDLKELEPQLSNGNNLSADKTADILSRQIRNVAKVRKEPPAIVPMLVQRRTIFVLGPCLLVLTALGYLYFKCYPFAVFLWGDAEDWYKEIVTRRNIIWTGILIALAVGVLGNLFVLGLHG